MADPKRQDTPAPNRQGNEGRPVVERNPDDKQKNLDRDMDADNPGTETPSRHG